MLKSVFSNMHYCFQFKMISILTKLVYLFIRDTNTMEKI